MKHSVILKFIAVFLAACALTLALASGFGVLMVADAGLYEQDFDTWYADMQNRLAEALAEQLIGSLLDFLRFSPNLLFQLIVVMDFANHQKLAP